MMMNLFSMFDMFLYYISPVVVIPIAVFLLGKKNQYPLNSAIETVMMKTLFLLHSEMSQDIKKLKYEKVSSMIKNTGASKLFFNLFLMVLLLNYMSLYPMVFSITSHINLTFTLSTVAWLSVMIMSVNMNIISFMSHFTPNGTPLALMSFMVCIETVSSLIRPITLAVRLTANMVAGHLLLFLLSKMMIMMSNWYAVTVPVMFLLSILETMVSIIQSYVITLLVILYFKESF